jgi:predicted nuclease of predicted toxin-antitoxin system
MRFLADVGISTSTAEMLRARGDDVLHLSEQGLHRLPDDEILALARRDGRAGALVIVEDNRYRLRRLPIQGFD